MAYTTEAKVENLLGITISGGGSSAMTDIIAAVKAWIDRYCGKTFEAASETRYYDGNGMQCMVIDSFVGTPTVTILTESGAEENTLTLGRDDDFITGPYNSTEKFELILTGLGKYGSWPHRLQAVKVTGSFGASTTVPADVQLAATRLAGQIYKDGTEGVKTSIRLGDYAATYAAVDEVAHSLGINNTLDQYRDINI